MRIVGICLALAVFALPVVAQAQNYEAYQMVFDKVRELNRSKPLQNPSLESAEDIFNRKITDRKNKVVGEVNDVTVDAGGAIKTLNANLKKLQLGDSVYLGYEDFSISPRSNSYALGYDDARLKTLFPSMLANVEPAAGTEADGLSTKNLIGAKIEARDGRNIGTVKTILFDNKGEQAKALYVTARYGLMGSRELAVPFDIGSIRHVGSSTEIVISNDAADALHDYVESGD